MDKPTSEQLEIAAQWLKCNEGEGTAADLFLRQEARKAGVPIARLRKRLQFTNPNSRWLSATK
jgi:hypothetical protein